MIVCASFCRGNGTGNEKCTGHETAAADDLSTAAGVACSDKELEGGKSECKINGSVFSA